MSGRVDVTKKTGWANKPSDRTVWRCPACGDQTLQGRKGGECGPCFLAGKKIKLVRADRERVIATGEETVAEPRYLADDWRRS